MVLYFAGAIASHLRVHDRDITSPGVPLLLAAAALVFRVLSA